MTKKEARCSFIEKRKHLSKIECEILSETIAKIFFKYFNLKNFQSIHIFLPIEQKAEINTWPIINNIRKCFPNVDIVIPKIDISNNILTSIHFTPELKLVNNNWGILEPEEHGSTYLEHLIDIVLIPLLAFDTNGNRVGYGKGFYDKFFLKCKKTVVKVGLSFFDPVENIEDISDLDIPLNYCITPNKVHTFKI